MPEPDEQKPARRVVTFVPGAAPAPVAGGGGGPHDPGMEQRVIRLEEQFVRIEALLLRIDDRVNRLDERLRHLEIEVAGLQGVITNLPSTWAMLTMMLGGQIALAGILVGALRLGGLH